MASERIGYLARRAAGEGLCRSRVERLFERADIRIDGSRPWDLQVLDERFFARVLGAGSLGLGESYMDRWWQCAAVDQVVERLLRARLDRQVPGFGNALAGLWARLANLQSAQRAFRVGTHHYDIGNDLFERMLDRRMIYSCGYWREAQDLDRAQQAKLDLVCRKLGLQPGMRVLDVGCGWGGAARFAAEHYGVEVVGVTVSQAQAELARQHCRGLPVEIRLQDYRDLRGEFDRVYSIGMFEHVGVKNYRTYFEILAARLPADGLLLLHTIGGNQSTYCSDRWIARYIFPNSMIPSVAQISQATEGLFVLEDWHNFGVDYAVTLLAWAQRFEAAWPELRQRYDQRFYRMWRYYLLACAGAFRARELQLWQLVLSPRGVRGGYLAPR